MAVEQAGEASTELNRPQLSVSALPLPPLIEPDGRISRIRLSRALSSGCFPCRVYRQFIESIVFVQSLVRVVIPQGVSAGVFAPEPASQSILASVWRNRSVKRMVFRRG